MFSLLRRCLKSRFLLVAFGLAATFGAFAGRNASAGEVGFVETFALAENRDDALKQLVPGTQEFYYFHSLHYQHQERYDDVETMLKPWIERHGYTQLVHEILHRQALLKYPQQPKESLEYLRRQLHLQFSHQRETLREKPNLPVSLDQNLLSVERLAENALAIRDDIGGFRPVAFDWIASRPEKMNASERRSLLASLERPDIPNLVDLIVADLAHPNRGEFGSLPIHSKLTQAQLDELLTKRPRVRDVREFVHVYLLRLVANEDVDVIDDQEAFLAQIDRQYAFAKTLSPSFNSLKAHLLYQRLEFDRSQGIYDRERFMEYVKLPRFMPYVNGKWMEIQTNRDYAVNLGEDYRFLTRCEPIGSDVQLVQDYLSHFFLTQNEYAEFLPFIREDFLRQVLAETKIVHGLGDQERWASVLTPEQFKALKERVDIDFAYVNPERYAPEDPVSLDVFVKNVPTLIVKVFEIDERNWYSDRLAEIDTSIELDGLTPNFEQTYKYDESPLLRVQRHFEFPMLTGRGIYVIDFIGAGQASRALVRKGRLRYVSQTTPAGQVFHVLDEKNELLKDASLLMGDVEYRPKDETGRILVPFSTNPGEAPIVLLHDDFATLEHFRHEPESYELRAGLYIDRESLLKQKTAKVIVRPQLVLNGEPISLKLLEDVKLTVSTQDASGTTAAMEAKDFALFEDRESTYDFRAPDNLRSVSVRIEAKVQHLQTGNKISLADEQLFQVNQISDTSQIALLHLAKLPSGYVLFVLGKTGEAIVDRPVQLTLEHRWFSDPIHATLKTDARGAVALGPLPGVLRLTASQSDHTRSFDLPVDRVDRRALYHLTTQDTLKLAYLGNAVKSGPDHFTLLEVRQANYVRDAQENLSIEPGYLVVTKLAPGDYELFLKETQERIQLRVTQGTSELGYLLGDRRILEATPMQSLQLISVERGEIEVSKIDDGDAEANGEDEPAENPADEEAPQGAANEKEDAGDGVADLEMATVLKLKLGGGSKLARVHVIADRFLPAFSAYGILSEVGSPEATAVRIPDPRSFYLVGRNIGDEYRYIIDRKYARKFAGNMLERPTLLLNPWALRSTATDVQLAAEGAEFEQRTDPRASTSEPAPGESAKVAGGMADPTDIDFLATTSVHLLNLVPDDEGYVYVPVDLLEGCGFVQAIAVDPTQTVYRTLVAPEGTFDFRDLRLLDGLDPKRHYAQTRKIEVLGEGDSLVLPDVSVAELETYDSVGSLFELLLSASGNPTLAEFGFLARWDSLPPEEKRTLYSKYACHELHFFLFEKDPAFFEQVVRPYLAHKKEKTFFDRWLLGEDLREFTNPWQWQRLNVVEKVLLARRIEGDGPHALKWIQDRLDMTPPNPEGEKALFEQALAARGLRAGAASVSGRLGEIRSELEMAERTVHANGQAPADLARMNMQMNWAAPASGPEDANFYSQAGGGIGGGGFAFGGAAGLPAPAMAPPPAPAAEPANQPMQAAAEELKKMEKQSRQSDEFAAGKDQRFRRLSQLAASRDKSGEVDALAAYDDAVADRKSVRQLFRQVDQTMEYVESNYYRLPKEGMTQDLIGPSEFWRDYAAAPADAPFRSTQIARPTRNLHEMLLALAAIDLPFEAGEHDVKFEEARMELRPKSPMIAFFRQIEAVEPVEKGPEILLSQNFFQANDRYRVEQGEQLDKFVKEEFIVSTVYGCQLVLTNPTSSPQRLETLVQIPEGAMPLAGTKRTETRPVELGPYSTTTLEYFFYFPASGKFDHFPAHVSRRGELISFAEPFAFNVVDEPSKIDTQSWAYVSQYGTDEEVIQYLLAANLAQTDLSKIAFRMKDKAYFVRILDLLEERHAYDRTLWSYAIHHDVPERVRQFLAFEDGFVSQVGLAIDSPLLVVEPIERNFYEHREYKPLVNARRHRLGPHWTILNDRFYEHYSLLMKRLTYAAELDDMQHLEATYYLALQDRIEEALAHFAKADARNLSTKMQYDYCMAYLAFSQERPAEAGEIAAQYRDYPVDRWRNLFASIERQIEEIGGKPGELVDEKNRDERMAQLAASQPTFDLRVEGGKMRFNYQALDEVRVSFYLMDLELLFSRNPFVKEFSGEFSYVEPNLERTFELPAGQKTVEIPLPPELANQNVLALASAAGRDQAAPYYANSLDVQTFDAYGQLRVLAAGTGDPLSKAYVKVYAQRNDGTIRFYKDGYTDLRGRFDYASLSTNDLDFVERFAVLVMTDEHGAVVRELDPPKR